MSKTTDIIPGSELSEATRAHTIAFEAAEAADDSVEAAQHAAHLANCAAESAAVRVMRLTDAEIPTERS